MQATMEKISMMTSAKHSLARIPPKNRDNTFSHILTLIDGYIQANCNHSIIRDLIDIDPERSQTIYYCEHCYTEFIDCHGTPKKISSQCK
jgi:hypothetical protein